MWAISSISLLRIAVSKLPASLTGIMKEPGPPMTPSTEFMVSSTLKIELCSMKESDSVP